LGRFKNDQEKNISVKNKIKWLVKFSQV